MVAKHPEQRARRQIDGMLAAAGWAVQDRAAMNLAAASGVAIRELPTAAGPADYMLFLGNRRGPTPSGTASRSRRRQRRGSIPWRSSAATRSTLRARSAG